ncbi:MAG: permease [Tissierellales bacterium]|jgi:uncharacterized membrane protein YraQ (UPF0718 family)|nr:permease [Tissierellales bacterium]
MFDWLDKLVESLVVDIMGISMETGLGSGIHFFIYDTIKIIILLGIMIFAISYIRSFFPVERTKKIVEKISGIKGNIMASLLGIVTPFCSCSSVPLFIGFVEAGIPIGVTFSFLITSPIVNEAAFAILLASFGWKVALLYVITGVVIGVVGGILIDKLHLEDQVESYVYEIKMGETEVEELNHKQRVNFAIQNVKDIVKRVWLFLLVGIGIGAFIHGWVPDDGFFAQYANADNPFAVIVATIVAIPLYSNALGMIPVAEAMLIKGAGLGTALSFMMAVTALSAPEMILLRKVIKPKLIASFVAITGIGIVLVGYLFNGVGHLIM